jgi:tetratricopeptide (TPR) repeat protein
MMKKYYTIIYAAFFLFSIIFLQPSLTAQEAKRYKTAVLSIATPLNTENKDIQSIAALCEAKLMGAFASDNSFQLIERQAIDKILREYEMSNSNSRIDPIKYGQMLGADILIFGRIFESVKDTRCEIKAVQTSIGTILNNSMSSVPEPIDKNVSELIAGFKNNVGLSLAEIKKREGLPSASIISIKNTSIIHRLDYLENVLKEIIEKDIIKSGNYRLLPRRHTDILRKETEFSYGGFTSWQESVLAEKADLVLSVEFEEKPSSGISFEDTPVLVKVAFSYRDGNSTMIEESGANAGIKTIFDTISLKTSLELCKKGNSPVNSPKTPETKTIEAAILIQEFVKQLYVTEHVGGDNYWEYDYENMSENNIELLNKALYLDPSISIARYYLASLLSFKANYTNAPPLEQAADEFEIFILSNPSKPIMIRACHRLASCYELLIHNYRVSVGELKYPSWMNKTQNQPQLSDIEKGKLRLKLNFCRRRIIEILKLRLSIDTENRMTFLYLPVWIFGKDGTKDAAVLSDWFNFVDKTYGKDHAKKTINCPLFDAALYLYEVGAPRKALEFYERALKEHKHDKSDDLTLLAKIFTALGEKDKTTELQNNFPKDTEEYRKREIIEEQQIYSQYLKWPVSVPAAVFPAELLLKMPWKFNPLNNDEYVLAMEKTDGKYFIFTGKGMSNSTNWGQKEGRYLSGFKTYHSYTWDGRTDKFLPFSIDKTNNGFHVTSVRKLNDILWLGTTNGIVKLNPKNLSGQLLAEKDGLPASEILSSAIIDGNLWFGPSYRKSAEDMPAIIFSLDPNSLKVNTYFSSEKHDPHNAAIKEIISWKEKVLFSGGRSGALIKIPAQLPIVILKAWVNSIMLMMRSII